MRPTGPGPITVFAVVGLVLGWVFRPLALWAGWTEPVAGILTIVLLFFCAALLGGAAYLTRRTVRLRRPELAPHHAVNRLVLGKAAALVAALGAGCFLGYAVAQLGLVEPLATTRLWRSSLAGLGCLACCVGGLLLEHACRVPPDEDEEP